VPESLHRGFPESDQLRGGIAKAGLNVGRRQEPLSLGLSFGLAQRA
jgi:hypothetical protein